MLIWIIAVFIGILLAGLALSHHWRGKRHELEFSDRFDFYDSSNPSYYRKHPRFNTHHKKHKK